MNQTVIFTIMFESVFNSGSSEGSPSLPLDKRFSSIPLDKGIVRPFDTGPTAPPFYLRSASTPINKGTNLIPIDKGPTVTPSTGIISTLLKWPTTRQRWDLKPPEDEIKRSTHVSSDTGWGHSSLDNVLWVVLGGFVVLILLAIFMKLGKPFLRVRRRLYARSAPNVITRRQNPDDRNLDMGSLLRLTDPAASTDQPLYDDLPPPYSECAHTNKYDTEEPPPRFSACFVTHTNTKDTEPKVHIQRQNVLFEDHAMNDSEDIDGMRTELVLVNGRIVERPKFDLNSHTKETEVAGNDADFKGRVVYKTDHVKVNIY